MANTAKVLYRGPAPQDAPLATWTTRQLAQTRTWFGPAFGAGVFVLVGQTSNVALTSPDGVNWTARTLPTSSGWTDVIFAGGQFVAISNSTAAATSPDGITWTARTNGGGALAWVQVAYGNGTYVAVQASGSSAGIATSPDGITWTSRVLPNAATYATIAYGNGQFVVPQPNSSNVYTSPDGTTWTTRSMGATAAWGQVAFGNGVHVAVVNGSTVTAYSTNGGVSWTAGAQPVAGARVSFANGYFFAMSTAGAATSIDGINWTSRTLPVYVASSSVAYGNSITVANAGATGVSYVLTTKMGGTGTVLYTTPVATTAVVTDVYVSNPSGTAGVFALFYDGVAVTGDMTLSTFSAIQLTNPQVLQANRSVSAYCSVGGASVHVCGVEIA